MYKCQKNKLWLENICNLFCSSDIVPMEGMSLAEQMNAITRLVIIVYIILILAGFQYSTLFFLLSLLLIIILYYIQERNMTAFKTECYKPPCNKYPRQSGIYIGKSRDGTDKLIFDNPTSKRFCNDERPIDNIVNDKNWMSENQKLVGPANPRTKTPPVVIAPAADLSYWKATNLSTFPQINSESQIDVYRSGYQVSTCCAPTYNCQETCGVAIPRIQNNTRENFEMPYMKNDGNFSGGECSRGNCSTGNCSQNFPHYIPEQVIQVTPNGSGQVNTGCGYNPKQFFTAGLPTNLPAGNCQQDPSMKYYNDNLYTQTIQPDVYTRSQINEPINSNIGISFTQQFPPLTCNTDMMSGVVNYTEHDPRIYTPEPVPQNSCVKSPVDIYNVYDPRFTGYGTSYRSYTDDNIGQTKFYYDDVDAIRMPNYLVRSNIDHQPFADQYGPLPTNGENGNRNNPDIHSLANDSFLTASIQQRTDLQERLMRKVNAEQWQKRSAPKSTQQRRMIGGLGAMNM